MTDYIIGFYIVPFLVMICYEVAAIKRAQRKRLWICSRYWYMLGRCALPVFDLLFACFLLINDLSIYLGKQLKKNDTTT